MIIDNYKATSPPKDPKPIEAKVKATKKKDDEKATNKEDKRVFQNRAKRKYLSQSLSLGLVKATEIKHEKILQKVKKEGWKDQNLQDFNENVQASKSYWCHAFHFQSS